MIKNLEEAAREYYKRGQLGLEKASDTERAFTKGAEWMQEQYHCTYAELYTILEDCNKPRKTMFTEEQMFEFAGFCAGRKMINPFEDLKEIMNEFKQTQNVRN